MSNWNLGRVALILCTALVVAETDVLHAQSVDFDQLNLVVEKIRAKHQLPAMGVALVTLDGVTHAGVSGTRKRGDKTPVTDDDLWHLGSDGKAMTATMIARLVERGLLRWDQTLGETFASLAQEMKEGMRAISLSQLLSHQSGLPANFDLSKYTKRRNLREARVDVLKEAMKKGLQSEPGSKYLYSNWGYVIAACMAEQVTDKDFETLMREEVFDPLHMTTAGFGGIGTVGKIDQPWPHTANGKPTSSNGPAVDNVPTMAPAGTIHMTLNDWGKFVAEHLKGSKGKSQLLKKESFDRLHLPNKSDYAFGWISAKRGWAGTVPAITHAGDNTMNYALVWAAPQKGFAVLVVTNQSGANAAADELASALILAWPNLGKPRK